MEALNVPEEVLISAYLAPYRASTRRGHYRVLLTWLAWCLEAGVHMLQARQLHAEQWARSLAAEGNSRSTVAGKLLVVCGWYRWAHQQGHLDADPMLYVRRPSRPRRSNQRWLTREQLADLLRRSRGMPGSACALVHLLALNGLRLGETLAARVEHLGEQDGRTTLTLPNRKAGVMDRVSLPVETVTALQPLILGRDQGLLLRRGDGRALTAADVYRLLDQLSAAMEIGYRVRPHMLRATFVTLALDAGVPARDVMASTGHAHTAMVDYYDRAHAAIRRNASHAVAEYLRME